MSGEYMDFSGILYFCVILVLIILFVVSISLYFRRLITNTSSKAYYSEEINKKLDIIIEILNEKK